jgi:protein phosphatase
VDEAHLGQRLRCGHCNKPFQIRAEPAPSGVRTALPPPPSRLEVGAATSPGRVRARNEDSFLVQHLAWSNRNERHEAALLVVADGMGGHEGGEMASGLLVRTVAPLLTSLLANVPFSAAAQVSQAIKSALQEANRVVYQEGQRDPTCRGMGATVAVVIVCNGVAVIGHVGDCRVYHQRGGQLTQLTRDQTLVARMVELGTLTPREAELHPSRNEVTHAVGKAADLEPAGTQQALAVGDWLVAACDGLHAHLDLSEIEEEVNWATSAQALADKLVERSNQEGGSDNCTVLCLRCC